MSDKKEKTGIFNKILEAGEAFLEAQIFKAKSSLEKGDDPEFLFGKAITKDRYHLTSSQGYHEKPGMIGNEFQKLMAIRSSIVSAIIRTRQNKVSAYSVPAKVGDDIGYRIVIKNKELAIEKIKEELLKGSENPEDKTENKETRSNEMSQEFNKANIDDLDLDMNKEAEQVDREDGDLDGDGSKEDNPEQISDLELTRKATEILNKKIKSKVQAIEEFLFNCGELKERPFETKKWNFDAFLRAIVWDSLVYDQLAVEFVPKEAERLNDKFNVHHFYPVDASTIRFATSDLKNYGSGNEAFMPMSQYNILYPEDELKALQESDAIRLDDERLAKNEYKYVQLIRGRIERAFTEDELAFGIRNPITDIFLNGYGLSELEVLVGLVTSHLHTEQYNKAYFQQGFSAKGILHIKANLNRSKLEELRRHWHHMVSGNRNSFQTPIMSGMDEIQWIPLTQSHSEMEFNLWLNYLVKMICAIYQIDPLEIGYGIREEGRGGSLGGDNTEQKLEASKDKGFVPLMKFLQAFVNDNIISKLDPEFKFEWVGLISDDAAKTVGIELQEVKYKKTVNELREKDGLRPIPGADDLILDPTYFQFFTQFHPEARKILLENQKQQMAMQQEQQQKQMEMQQDFAQQNPQDAQQAEQNQQPEPSLEEKAQVEEKQKQADHEREKELIEHKAKIENKYSDKEPVAKSLKVEYYKIGK